MAIRCCYCRNSITQSLGITKNELYICSPQDDLALVVSVLMPIDENDHQLLGFVELNGQELYNSIGKRHGMVLPILKQSV
jgi:hypothetical protein